MPSWTEKDKRQYEAVRGSELERGRTMDKAEEIAARTVNKQRRLEHRTPNQTTQGTGNPHSSLEERSLLELRNVARELLIEGRSKMSKASLISAVRAKRGH